jgi:hypothetical protein
VDIDHENVLAEGPKTGGSSTIQLKGCRTERTDLNALEEYLRKELFDNCGRNSLQNRYREKSAPSFGRTDSK